MHQIQNTLFVLSQRAFLRLQTETVRVEVGGVERLRVPLLHVSSVVVFGNVMLSPALIEALAQQGSSVVWLGAEGRFVGRLQRGVTGNVHLRRAQHAMSVVTAEAAKVSASFVAGKLHNARNVLLRAAREARNGDAAAALRAAADISASSLRGLDGATELDSIRGFEGNAARAYFGVMNHLVRVDDAQFHIAGRTRRPPRDRTNALLSFAYALLLTDCVAALESVGLDPQLGFLHGIRPGRPGLALDLMEEFRPLIADRLVLSLINRRQVNAKDFDERPGGAIWLGEEARRTMVSEYQARKREEITHPLLGNRMPWSLVPMVQARLLARHVRGDAECYVPFVPR